MAFRCVRNEGASHLNSAEMFPDVSLRQGGTYLNFLFSNGMDKFKSPGKQTDATVIVGPGRSVFQVAFNRASDL